MFPASYFAPGYFAPAYWIDGIPQPVVAPASGQGDYFAPSYYSGYFAPAYWPGGPTPVIITNLMAAILAKAEADSTLAGLLFYRSSLPPDYNAEKTPAVYTIVRRTSSRLLLKTSTSRWYDETVEFTTYALDDDTAEENGELLRVAVPKWGALRYQTGQSVPLIESSGMADLTKNRRRGDKGACFVRVVFSARTNRIGVPADG